MSEELSTSRYRSAVRRYNQRPITNKAVDKYSQYGEATYLGFDATAGVHKYQTSRGIKTAKSLSNISIPKDGTVLFSQGFNINPY